MLRFFMTALTALVLLSGPALARTGQAGIDALLAADRAFADAADAPSAAEGLAPMFDAEAVMPSGPARLVGRAAVLAALRDSPGLARGAHSKGCRRS